MRATSSCSVMDDGFVPLEDFSSPPNFPCALGNMHHPQQLDLLSSAPTADFLHGAGCG